MSDYGRLRELGFIGEPVSVPRDLLAALRATLVTALADTPATLKDATRNEVIQRRIDALTGLIGDRKLKTTADLAKSAQAAFDKAMGEEAEKLLRAMRGSDAPKDT